MTATEESLSDEGGKPRVVDPLLDFVQHLK